MGALKDKAKAQSKFLMIDKGEAAIVQFVGYKFIPHDKDPTVEVALFEFKENGSTKFWKSASGAVMKALDSATPGNWVKITRGRKLNADGSEDESKSQWKAELLVDYKPGAPQTTAAASKVATEGTGTQTKDVLEEADQHLKGGQPADDPFNVE